MEQDNLPPGDDNGPVVYDLSDAEDLVADSGELKGTIEDVLASPEIEIEATVESPALVEPELAVVPPETDIPQNAKKEEMQTQIETLQQELEKATNDKDQYYQQMVRTAADMENLRKRTRREVNDSKVDTRAKTVREILPVIDNLQRAVDHAAATASEDDATLKGVQMVLKQFSMALEKMNIKQVDALGNPFDPNVHEAISQMETDEFPPGSVCAVMQQGYVMGDRLLRPTMVVVATALTSASDSSAHEPQAESNENVDNEVDEAEPAEQDTNTDKEEVE